MDSEMGGIGTFVRAKITDIEVHDYDKALETLQAEWDELLDASDQCVYFLRANWNKAWWQTLRPAHSQLFIVTCRDESGRLVGLAPFYRRQHTIAGIEHIREILFLGTGVFAQTSEHLDIIARRGWETRTAEAVASLLRQDKEWDRLCLNEIPASSSLLPHFKMALGGELQLRAGQRGHTVSTDRDWESFKATLGRTTRQNTQRLSRRLFEKYTCEFRRVADREEFERGMDALVRLHQARWEAKGEPGSFAIPGVEGLLRQAAEGALSEGRLRLWTLTIDGKIAAVQLAFLDNRTAHCFQVGFDPAYARDSIGKVMLMLCIKDCVDDPAVAKYDLMGGDQPYKECWARAGRQSLRVVCLRSSIRSLAYTSIKAADQIGRSMARMLLPSALKLAGHRMLERRHYAEGPAIPAMTLHSR